MLVSGRVHVMFVRYIYTPKLHDLFKDLWDASWKVDMQLKLPLWQAAVDAHACWFDWHETLGSPGEKKTRVIFGGGVWQEVSKCITYKYI